MLTDLQGYEREMEAQRKRSQVVQLLEVREAARAAADVTYKAELAAAKDFGMSLISPLWEKYHEIQTALENKFYKDARAAYKASPEVAASEAERRSIDDMEGANRRWMDQARERYLLAIDTADRAFEAARTAATTPACAPRARKHNRVPWADCQKVGAFYAEARARTASTGIPHEVDHIVPERGRLVSGLHVEGNLRVLTRTENARKSYHFDPMTYEVDDERPGIDCSDNRCTITSPTCGEASVCDSTSTACSTHSLGAVIG